MNKKTTHDNQINIVKKEIPEIVVLGISHKSAPLNIREKFAFSYETSNALLSRAREGGICEIVYVNTCNRVEIYFTAHDVKAKTALLLDLLEEFTQLDKQTIVRYVYKKFSREAAVHLFSVASSVDSMVIGENEIYNQIKNAYKTSVEHNFCDIILNRLFHQAFNTAKKVRSRTNISKNTVSVASIATDQCKKMFHDFSRHSALLIGAGEIGKLILKYFTKFNIKHISVSNRTRKHVDDIVREINTDAHFVLLNNISELVNDVDIIISTITYDGYIISKDMISASNINQRKYPLVIFDLAVPRNVDPDIDSIDNVYVYNIDDLKSIAEENKQNRANEIELALDIIHSDSEEFFNWYYCLEIIPVIKKIQDQFDSIRQQELEKYKNSKLNHLSDNDFEQVVELTRQIMTKTLHNPIMALKSIYNSDSCGYHDKEFIKEKTQMLEDLFNK